MISTIEALGLVEKERNRQNSKWGYPQYNSPTEWLCYLMEEVGELAMAINDGNMKSAIEEAVQVSALSMAIVEHFKE